MHQCDWTEPCRVPTQCSVQSLAVLRHGDGNNGFHWCKRIPGQRCSQRHALRTPRSDTSSRRHLVYCDCHGVGRGGTVHPKTSIVASQDFQQNLMKYINYCSLTLNVFEPPSLTKLLSDIQHSVLSCFNAKWDGLDVLRRNCQRYISKMDLFTHLFGSHKSRLPRSLPLK